MFGVTARYGWLERIMVVLHPTSQRVQSGDNASSLATQVGRAAAGPSVNVGTRLLQGNNHSDVG